jgi:pimeloyl-ACP methyl ester carboxylesterase
MNHTYTHRRFGIEFGARVCFLAMFLLSVAGCSPEGKNRTVQERYPMKQVSVQGIDIHYIEKGEGKPLVLVHGIPTSSFLWRDMIEELSAHGRVIAPDLPGFGFSDPPPNGDYSISSYAGLLQSFLEALSVEAATLVCHDYGGPITVTYALRNPEKWDRLVLLDTFLHNELPPWPMSTKVARIRPVGELFMWLGGKSIARSGLEQGVVDKSRISDEIVRRYYMPGGTADKLNRTMLGTLRADYAEDLEFIEKNLGTIERPTLILWGEEDVFLPPYLADLIHKDIRGSALVKNPNCGHFIQEDQPDWATRRIVEFLNGQ